MRRIFLFFFFISFGLIPAQNSSTPVSSFEIIENSIPEKNQFYIESISKANFEAYRLKEKSDTLEFKNGFRLVLLSAKEMFLKGSNINIKEYRENRNATAPLPVFVVFENGWIGAEVKPSGKGNQR